MTENNEKSVPDEEAIKFSQQNTLEYLKIQNQCRLSQYQREQLISMLEGHVDKSDPYILMDISQPGEKRRFIQAFEDCRTLFVFFEGYHREYASSFVIRKRTELALKHATEFRKIITGYDPLSNHLKYIISDMKLINAVKEIESRLSKYLNEMKPKKHRFLEYSRNHILIPGLVRVLSWYLSDPYFKNANGKSIRDDGIVDIYCEIVEEILNIIDIPAPSSGDTSIRGEPAQGRLRKRVKDICKELDDPNKGHLVNIHLDSDKPAHMILPST